MEDHETQPPEERKPQVHVEVALSTSSPKISLSEPCTEPTQAIVTARIVESTRPASPITLLVDKTPLDGGHDGHDALFRGEFDLTDITDKSRSIMLKPLVHVNYGRPHDNDMRKVPRYHFATIPAKGQGELTVKYDLTPERLFRFETYSKRALKRKDVKPGDKFRLRMQKLLGWTQWWTFGDLEGDLKDKKFLWNWEPPDTMDWFTDFIVDGEKPTVEMMKRDGWVFSQPRHDFLMTTDTYEGVILEFVD